jgi:hypothetical protein
MEVRKDEIDSEILGGAVLAISDFDGARNFPPFEEEYRQREHPIYVTCKIPAEDIGSVHMLEDQGFRFVEFQMRLRGTLARSYDTSSYEYTYLPLSGERDLDAVLDLASSIFEHDRVTRDPFFQRWGERNISGERYRRYVLQASRSTNECVYKLVSNSSGDIVGFSSHRMLSPESALLLIGGVRKEYRASGVGAINDYFALNELKRKGVKLIHTHVSGANYAILNLEVKGIGFRVVSSAIVMRKIYPENIPMPKLRQ